MTFVLSEVVPWGRSFEEYAAMFALSAGDLSGRILGCGDGPASFNARLTARGGKVVSLDPLYRYAPNEIRARIRQVAPAVMAQTRANADSFVWRNIQSPDELERLRLATMEEFLADFATPQANRRYVAAALPHLPFADGEFDLALCSHFLFLYSDQHSVRFHIDALVEMCRAAGEVRVFPLVDLAGRPSPHLQAVRDDVRARGHDVTIADVPYEFQKGAHQMLVVRTRNAV